MAKQSEYVSPNMFSPVKTNSKSAVLYYDDVNPASRMCLMCVELLQAPVERKSIDTLGGRPISASVESINFMYYVPTFVQGSLTLTSCHAVLIYMCEQWQNDKTPNLLPEAFQQRMLVLNRLFFNDNIALRRHSDLMTTIIREGYKNMDHELQGRRIYKLYELLEVFLNEYKYMAGDMLTIADIAILATIESLDLYMSLDSLKTKLPKLYAWFKKVLKLPMHNESVAGLEKQKTILESYGHFKFSNKRPSNRNTKIEKFVDDDLKDEATTLRFDTFERRSQRILSGIIGVKCKLNNNQPAKEKCCNFSFQLNCASCESLQNLITKNYLENGNIENVRDSFEKKAISPKKHNMKTEHKELTETSDEVIDSFEKKAISPKKHNMKTNHKEQTETSDEVIDSFEKKAISPKKHNIKTEHKEQTETSDEVIDSFEKKAISPKKHNMKTEHKEETETSDEVINGEEWKLVPQTKFQPKRQIVPKTTTGEERKSVPGQKTEPQEKSKLVNRTTDQEQRKSAPKNNLQQEKPTVEQKKKFENVPQSESRKERESLARSDLKPERKSNKKTEIQEDHQRSSESDKSREVPQDRRAREVPKDRRESNKAREVPQDRRDTNKAREVAQDRRETKNREVAQDRRESDKNREVPQDKMPAKVAQNSVGNGKAKRQPETEKEQTNQNALYTVDTNENDNNNKKNLVKRTKSPITVVEQQMSVINVSTVNLQSKNQTAQLTNVVSAYSSIMIYNSSVENFSAPSSDSEQDKEQDEELHDVWKKDVEEEEVEEAEEENESEEQEEEEEEEPECKCDKCVGCNLNIDISVPNFCNKPQCGIGEAKCFDIKLVKCNNNKNNSYPSKKQKRRSINK